MTRFLDLFRKVGLLSMAKQKQAASKTKRNFPTNNLEHSLRVAQKIADERGGNPFKRLLLADALGLKPGSSNYRVLLSSAHKYGLTEGTEKASEISLTELGAAATQTKDASKRLAALRQAVLTPPLFNSFFNDYRDKRLPSPEMLGKILHSDYNVPSDRVSDCAVIINENGRLADIIRDIGGSPHVLLDAPSRTFATSANDDEDDDTDDEGFHSPGHGDSEDTERPANEREPGTNGQRRFEPDSSSDEPVPPNRSKPIFIGHGKNRVPLQKLQAILATFQIPHKITVQEANLGRPIPQKVKDTIDQCGSAILIFTKDEKLFDSDGNEIWRPSENVVHELGATSYAFGDRVVVFKEKGLTRAIAP